MEYKIGILILLSVFIFPSLAAKGYYFNITDSKCGEGHPEWFINWTCGVVRLNDKNMGIVDLEAILLQPLKHMTVVVKILEIKSNGLLRSGAYSFKVDGCSFLDGKGISPVGDLFYSYLDKVVKIQYKCPIPPGHVEFKNFSLKSNMIPIVPPVGEYKIELKGYNYNPDIYYGFVDIYLTYRKVQKNNGKRY